MEHPDTNPKTRHGQAKPGIHAVPPGALLHLGRAMEDGEVKYGLTNWRDHKVSASVYYNAAFRHLAAWWDGERYAPDSGVHHLGHAMACCAILLDAEAAGNLNDNRPGVPGPFAALVSLMTREIDHEAPASRIADEVADVFSGAAGVPEEFDADPARLDAEEIALRVMSCDCVEHAADVLRTFLPSLTPLDGEAKDPEVKAPAAADEPDEHPFWEVARGLVRPAVTSSELYTVIGRFLQRAPNESKERSDLLDTYSSFLERISKPLYKYDQRDRTRLCFFLEATEAGLALDADQMDDVLSRILGGEQ